MICYVLAMGKQHLGPHVIVGYGIKIFSPGLFITSPDHLEIHGQRPPKMSRQGGRLWEGALTRVQLQTILGQNFSLLEYVNSRDLPHAPMPTSIWRKNLVLSIEKFQFLVHARNTIILQHLIIHFSLHYLSSGRLKHGRLKQRKISNYQLYVDGVVYERWSLTRCPKCSDLTWNHLVFWKTGR